MLFNTHFDSAYDIYAGGQTLHIGCISRAQYAYALHVIHAILAIGISPGAIQTSVRYYAVHTLGFVAPLEIGNVISSCIGIATGVIETEAEIGRAHV